MGECASPPRCDERQAIRRIGSGDRIEQQCGVGNVARERTMRVQIRPGRDHAGARVPRRLPDSRLGRVIALEAKPLASVFIIFVMVLFFAAAALHQAGSERLGGAMEVLRHTKPDEKAQGQALSIFAHCVICLRHGMRKT